ncbi:hypothetical protein ATANTOWER_028393 [Ataeniobius toweri]|uniref:Uncharacterized protein n=1 Tax=Ataeniobius toweri TaxID=208326 RepID=A0ABU7CIS9_9TELE|nr:hypothetical protein [Ataeniobius toweri]
MTRRKPGKRWGISGNEEDPNKRARTAQLSYLPAATNVHVETDQQYLAQGSEAQESISTVLSIEDNEEPSSRSAFRDLPDGLTTEEHGSAEYDPPQSFEEALPDVGDWTYDDRHGKGNRINNFTVFFF